MERRLFVIVVLSGLCLFTSCVQRRQYSFIETPQTWPDARRYCRDQHTDLATVNDEDDLEQLTGLIESGVSLVFLGLYRSWGWSLSDADDYKEGERTFWKWTSGEPLDKAHYCGSIGGTGEWVATDCSSSLNFSCYDESISDPSDRFTPGSGSMSWLAAQSHCRELHTDLARVRNQLDNEELQRMAAKDQIWIGLTGTSWSWSDGSEPSYTPWRSQEASSKGLGDCGVLEVNGKPVGMIEGDCAQKLPFFCYKDAVRKRVVGLKLTADSSVNMADPAVKESILKLVQRKLSDQGATKDVHLSWRKLPEKEEASDQEQTSEVVCVP